MHSWVGSKLSNSPFLGGNIDCLDRHYCDHSVTSDDNGNRCQECHHVNHLNYPIQKKINSLLRNSPHFQSSRLGLSRACRNSTRLKHRLQQLPRRWQPELHTRGDTEFGGWHMAPVPSPGSCTRTNLRPLKVGIYQIHELKQFWSTTCPAKGCQPQVVVDDSKHFAPDFWYSLLEVDQHQETNLNKIEDKIFINEK